MPRGKLNERHVQNLAVAWIEARFRAYAEVQYVVSAKETLVVSNTNLGRGRADGLVAAAFPDGSIQVASIEAKSSRTLSDISFYYLNNPWGIHSLAAGVFGLLCSLPFGWYIDNWFVIWILPLMMFFIIGFTYLFATLEHPRYQSIKIINQVRRYPANEQWIAISSDAYNRLSTSHRQKLHQGCQKHGIGFIQVTSSTKVKCLEVAIAMETPKGVSDFLVCYARGDALRRKLNTTEHHRENDYEHTEQEAQAIAP
jgi:hypothetical protein